MALVQVQQSVRGLWCVAAVLVAGLACAGLGRTFGRLCAVVPSGVGLPAYLSRAYGRRRGLRLCAPYLGLMVALAGVEAHIVGSLTESLLGWPAWSGATGFLLGTWAVCRLGMRPGYAAQVAATAAVMLLLATLSILALAGAWRAGALPDALLAAPPAALGFLAAVGQALFLFMGFELVTSHVEVVGSARPIAAALTRSAAVLTAFYVLLALGLAVWAPAAADLRDPRAWLTPQLSLARAAGHGVVLALVAGACLTASFSSFNGALLALSRLVYALAAQGLMPSALARTDPDRLVPARALDVLLAASLLAAGMLALGGRAATVLVLGGAAAAASLVYAGALWARERSPYREPGRAPALRPLAAGGALVLLLLGSGALLDAGRAALDTMPATPARGARHGH